MTDLELLVENIPIRHNLVSYFMFAGVVVGFLLAGVILARTPWKNRALVYFGILVLAMSITNLDTFLCYTGWMKFTLAWNDSTEPLTLLFAPLLYLCIRYLVVRRPLPAWALALHFLPALLYGLSQIGFYNESLAIKYNAYKGAYFSGLPWADAPEGTTYGYALIKDLQRWFLLFGFAIYGFLSLRLWYGHRKSFRNPASGGRISKYRFGRSTLAVFLASLVLLTAIYLSFEDDGGDHFLSLFITAIFLSASIAFLSESRFFKPAWLSDKYESSIGPLPHLTLSRLRDIAGSEEFFRSPAASLKSLAARFNTHPNVVSRLINQETDGNFNDFLNAYRIELAKEYLQSPEQRHLTIEAIGRSVGFRSKSSFYEAFRRHTGISPSRFMKTGEPS